MKRSHQTISSSSENEERSKKPKALQACSSCRRSKVRCEKPIGSLSSKTACLRCTSLGLYCSLAETNNSPSESHVSTGPDVSLHSESGSSTSIRRVPMTLAKNSGSIRNREVPWDELDKRIFECTTSPVVSLEIAIRRKYPHGSTSIGIGGHSSGGSRLNDILSDGQRCELLDLQVPNFHQYCIIILMTDCPYRFQKNYFPWLNLPDSDTLNEDPTWILAQCAVASRHFYHNVQSDVEYRLRKAAEDATFGQVFSTCPSVAAIQSLLVLSIWPLSREARPEQIRDHRMQLVSAATMAKNRKSHGLGDGLENRLVSELVRKVVFFANEFVPYSGYRWRLGILCEYLYVHFTGPKPHCDIYIACA